MSVIEVTDENFEQEVLKSDKPVLVDFWAPWCGPCRMIAPIIEELAKEYEGKVKVVKVNVDENPNTAAQYGIRSIPTLLLFKNGQVVDRLVGAQPKEALKERIDKHL
uniref:LPBCA THIOREDOXIN n=1 Tax=synthetic construct TaxID=32630 RepID=UPI0002638C92|nr:Chain A, LPBCA THIOREDOXIN [synthetic construct]2YJ7_B Chain B, LPBCA THIOREDOXIN [synthetic construct]